MDLSASGRVSGGALLSSGEAEDGSWWKAFRPAGRLRKEAIDTLCVRATGQGAGPSGGMLRKTHESIGFAAASVVAEYGSSQGAKP